METEFYALRKMLIDQHQALQTIYSDRFEGLLIANEGKLVITLDAAAMELEAPFIYLVPKNEVLEFATVACSTELSFLAFDRNIVPTYYFETAQFYKQRNMVDFRGSACFSNILSLLKMIEFESVNLNTAIIVPLIQSIYSIYSAERGKNTAVNDSTFDIDKRYISNFLLLLEKYYKEEKSLEFYAQEVGISLRHLLKLVKATFGVTIIQLIAERKMMEAKRLLIQSPWNISEIGFALGYKEKSHFSKAFKKVVGYSPMAYKKLIKNIKPVE